MQVMEKAAQKARQEHKCFLCKRSFDYNEETNFLKMLNEVNKDDSLEIVISDLKAKVKCIEQYYFSLVNDILPKEEMLEEKMLHDRLSKAINEKAKTLKTEEDSRNDALKVLENTRKLHGPAQKYLEQLRKYELKKEDYEEESSKYASLAVGDSDHNGQQKLEDIRRIKNEKENEKEEVEESIHKAQKKLDNFRQEIRVETSRYQKLLEKKTEIESSLKESAGIEDQIKRLVTEKKMLDTEIINLKDSMRAKREELNQTIILKNSEMNRLDGIRKELEEDFKACENIFGVYESSHATIIKYFSQQLQEQHNDLLDRQSLNKESIVKLSEGIEGKQKEVEALVSQKDDSKYRNLIKNIRFKELEKEIHDLEVEIEVQQSGLDDLNIPDAKKRYEDLQQRESCFQTLWQAIAGEGRY